MTQQAQRPMREVRARFDETAVRVYQSFPPAIADEALSAGTFKPPFQRDRMTWIKPSFTWMMYRCGFATKPGQERVLGIDILRTGFEWALGHSCLTHFDASLHADPVAWQASLRASPVRVQWDPERTLAMAPLQWRAIQIGLRGEAVNAYLDEWIVGIEDLTPLAREVGEAVMQQGAARVQHLVPEELPYPLPGDIGQRIGST